MMTGQVFFEFENTGRVLTQETLSLFWLVAEGRSVILRLYGVKKPLQGKLIGSQEDVIVIEQEGGGKRIIQIQEIERLELLQEAAGFLAGAFFDPLKTPIKLPEYDLW